MTLLLNTMMKILEALHLKVESTQMWHPMWTGSKPTQITMNARLVSAIILIFGWEILSKVKVA